MMIDMRISSAAILMAGTIIAIFYPVPAAFLIRQDPAGVDGIVVNGIGCNGKIEVVPSLGMLGTGVRYNKNAGRHRVILRPGHTGIGAFVKIVLGIRGVVRH